MSQTPDWSRLVRLWSVKAHWVPRTDEELKYISKEDGSYDVKKIVELRRTYNQENELEILNPWGLKEDDVQEQENSEKNENKKEEDVEEITLEDLQKEYEELYGKEAAPAYKNNVEWLAKKISEKTE